MSNVTCQMSNVTCHMWHTCDEGGITGVFLNVKGTHLSWRGSFSIVILWRWAHLSWGWSFELWIVASLAYFLNVKGTHLSWAGLFEWWFCEGGHTLFPIIGRGGSTVYRLPTISFTLKWIFSLDIYTSLKYYFSTIPCDIITKSECNTLYHDIPCQQ